METNPEGLLDQTAQNLLDQLAQASPWTSVVYGLILLILVIIAALAIWLFVTTNKKKDQMAIDYVKATVELSALKSVIESQHQKVLQVEDLLKDVLTSNNGQVKTVEQMEAAIQKIHGIVDQLNKIVWTNEKSDR